MNSRSRELRQAPAHCATTRREEGGGKREEGRGKEGRGKREGHRTHPRRKKSAQAEVAVEKVAAAAAEEQHQHVHNNTAKSEEEKHAARTRAQRSHVRSCRRPAGACKLLQSCRAVPHDTKACSPVHSREASSNLPAPPRPTNHTRTTAFCGRHTRPLRTVPPERK